MKINDLETKINDMLQIIIKEKKLPEGSLFLERQEDNKNENDFQLKIFEPEYPLPADRKPQGTTRVALLIKEDVTKANGGKIIVYVRNGIYQNYGKPATGELFKSDQVYHYVRFLIDDSNLIEYIKEIVEYKVKNYSSNTSFACCSRFNECSDAKECVHDNRLYSTGCQYRSLHLEKGEILYGKNRNV